MDKKVSGESVIKDIRYRTRKKYSSEEKIHIVIDGLRGEDSIPIYAVKKVFPPTYTTAGVKIFWEQARIVLWMIRPEKLTSIKWLTLKKHLKQLVAERRLLSRIEFLKKVLMGRTSRTSICETQSIRKAGDHSDRREDSELSICQTLKELGIHLKH
jgi:transposase